MPTKKKTTAKSGAAKKRTTRAKKAPVKASTRKRTTKKAAPKKAKRSTKVVNKVVEPMPTSANVCRSCHALPVGSVELVSLLLVLVFSLTAVLITSVHALSLQQDGPAHRTAQHHTSYHP